MKKTIGAALLVLVLVLTAVVLDGTFTFRSRQPAAAPVAVEPLDTAALAQRLAGALRFKTASYQDSTQFDAREFTGFQAYLRATFPRVHAALKLEKVNGYGLLYEWTGSDPTFHRSSCSRIRTSCRWSRERRAAGRSRRSRDGSPAATCGVAARWMTRGASSGLSRRWSTSSPRRRSPGAPSIWRSATTRKSAGGAGRPVSRSCS